MNRSLSLLNQNDFIIMVNEMQFACNTAAVNSSNVILKLRNEDPNLKKFEYKYDGNPEDFRPICDFFNFKEITITMENMDSLLQIANDFQINSIIELIGSIHKYDDIYDLLTQKCDNINEIFESLYQINQISVETVKQTILKSIWIHTEDNIKELTAVFHQVLGMRLNLQENILELLISLDKSATEENDLHLFLPNMIKMLKFNPYSSIYNYLFIYKMIKKGFFTMEEYISFNVSKQILSSTIDLYFYLVFFPEIIEFRKITLDTLCDEIRNKKDQLQLLKYFGQIGIERFKKIRDSGEPEDELSRAIAHDDVDKLQSLVSINIEDINTKFIPINLFDPFGNTVQTSYLNFACECGSIKCVKYLLLNHAEVDQLTFGFAILGNNSEIIHIIDQHNKNAKKVLSAKKTNSTWPQSLKNPIELTILLHQYNLFDWLFENNFSQNNLNEENIIDLLSITFNCGNLYAFIRLIEGNQKLNHNKINLKQWLTYAAVRGFYRQMKALCIAFNCSDSIPKIEVFDRSPVLFGNMSIFKLFFDKKIPSFDYSQQLLFAIKYDHINIIKYIYDELYQPQEYQTLFKIYQTMIQSKSKVIADYFEEKYDFKKIIKKNEFISILIDLISINDIENCKKIIDIIIEKDSFTDFTDQFLKAALDNNNEICQCFLDKKVTIDLHNAIRNCLKNINTNEEILYKLIDNCNSFEKELFIQIVFNEAIINNINMAKNLIMKYKPSINSQSLFHAVSSHDEKLVADIFKCNIDSSTINSVLQEGSVLIIAVFNNDFEIVKILLESNQIDVNLYELKDGNTALITAVENSNKQIAKLLIEYPKTDINFANKNHQTALSIAVAKQQKEIVDLLIKNEKFDPIKSNINYAFFIADDEIAQLLITVNELNVNCLMYREINQKKTPYLKSSMQDSCMFESALEYALDKNYLNKIKLIISHPSFDPVKSKVNELVFYDLCMKNIEIFKQFIELIDNNVNIYSPKGELLLIHAINQGYISVVKEILNNPTFKPNKKEFLISFYLIKEKNLSDLTKDMLEYDQKHDHYLESDDNTIQIEDYKSNPNSNENKKDASESNSPLLLFIPKLNNK